MANTLASGQVGRLVNHKLLRNFLVFCVHACVRARRAINGGLGRSTNVCVGRSRKALFTCWLCLKHCTTAVATCGEKERVRSDLTSAETDFDLTLRGYIPKYGAYAYLAIPDWVNACVIFPILFFLSDRHFRKQNKLLFCYLHRFLFAWIHYHFGVAHAKNA